MLKTGKDDDSPLCYEFCSSFFLDSKESYTIFPPSNRSAYILVFSCRHFFFIQIFLFSVLQVLCVFSYIRKVTQFFPLVTSRLIYTFSLVGTFFLFRYVFFLCCKFCACFLILEFSVLRVFATAVIF